jgi:cobalt/nickel transport system permease protein
MHIPDGYLSPASCAVMYVAATPFWYRASQKVKRVLTAKMVPLIALFAAFSFVIMMFNVPLPGGTSGHAVGSALVAIILGPWPAVIAVSVALAIQALFFGDGGILAFGANSFNMAVVMPFVGYYIYRWISGRSEITSLRRPIGAAVAGYVALSIAALFTAIEFGLQPYLFKAADGTPLYTPYGLSVAIPAMMGPHLLVASVVEALVTGAIVAYLQRANQPLLMLTTPAGARERAIVSPRTRILWVGLAISILLAPLGLLAPGTAWGEWGGEELRELGLGFIPAGLERLGGIWPAPIPDYEVPGLNANLGYILSAVVGIVLVSLVTWLISRMVFRQPTEI